MKKTIIFALIIAFCIPLFSVFLDSQRVTDRYALRAISLGWPVPFVVQDLDRLDPPFPRPLLVIGVTSESPTTVLWGNLAFSILICFVATLAFFHLYTRMKRNRGTCPIFFVTMHILAVSIAVCIPLFSIFLDSQRVTDRYALRAIPFGWPLALIIQDHGVTVPSKAFQEDGADVPHTEQPRIMQELRYETASGTSGYVFSDGETYEQAIKNYQRDALIFEDILQYAGDPTSVPITSDEPLVVVESEEQERYHEVLNENTVDSPSFFTESVVRFNKEATTTILWGNVLISVLMYFVVSIMVCAIFARRYSRQKYQS